MDRSQNLRQLMKSTAESNKDKAKQLKQIRLKQKSDQQQSINTVNTINIENTYDTATFMSPSDEAPSVALTESKSSINTNVININAAVKQSKDSITNKSNLPVGFFDDPFQGLLLSFLNLPFYSLSAYTITYSALSSNIVIIQTILILPLYISFMNNIFVYT